MKKRFLVYMPRWIGGLVLALLAIVWVGLSWDVWIAPSPGLAMAMSEYLMATAVIALVAVVVVLLLSRRLPMYVVEAEEDEGTPDRK